MKEASYINGFRAGEKLLKQDDRLDIDALVSGLIDGYNGAQPKITQRQMAEKFVTYLKDLDTYNHKKAQAASEKNQEEERVFFEANRKNPDIIQLPDGLQYKVITVGTGRSPDKDALVSLKYTATYLDGEVLSTSNTEASPNGEVNVRLDQVSPGLQEAIQKMTEGTEWEIFIPAKLAHREGGPNKGTESSRALHYKVRLLSIEPKD